jgi:hypothetical protein
MKSVEEIIKKNIETISKNIRVNIIKVNVESEPKSESRSDLNHYNGRNTYVKDCTAYGSKYCTGECDHAQRMLQENNKQNK